VTRLSHDQNFKNVVLDFPVETLQWVLPEAIERLGPIENVEFTRQEHRKHKLSESHLALDMPILFTFRGGQKLLLWLVEFQEDKSKFSIYKLLRYATDEMEAHPDATVVPTVIFSDRRRWRKDVPRKLEARLGDRLLLHFNYIFLKLFDYNARDFFKSHNPVVKILLPKMNYAPAERWEVIRQAYIGLFELVSIQLFMKYTDFIDVYAEVHEHERETILEEIQERKETVMIKQILKEEGWKEGRQEASFNLLSRQLTKKFRLSQDQIRMLEGLRPEDMFDLGEFMLECDSFEEIENWIQQRKAGNLS
jgi:hypothetical protein